MNILLIAPEKIKSLKETKGTMPVPLLHLAAILREDGHNVNIHDFSTTAYKTDDTNAIINETMNVLEKVQPELVGINCFTSLHFPFTQLLSKTIKQYDKKIPVVLGGAHPSLFANEILCNDASVDYIIIGEGELQVVALAKNNCLHSEDSLSRIPALAFRDAKGRVVVTERNGFIDNLDSLPQPAWDLINFERYYADHSTWYNPKGLHFEACIPIITSRSCPFSCNFCACHATMGRKLRKRDPQLVVDEIQMLHEKMGQNYFGFIDDNVNIDKQHLIEICSEIVKRNLNIQWETTCGVHIGSLNGEVVDAMADSGCVFVRLPIEHGNDSIRNKIIGKNLSRKKIFSAAQNLKKRKIFTSSMFIMGFPEETNDSLEDTYKLICELQLDLNYVFNLIPFQRSSILKLSTNNPSVIACLKT